MSLMEMIREPWPWYVAGPMLALVMFGLVYFDRTFGFSSNLRTMCTLAGAGKVADFFRFDWRAQKWNLMFLAGTILGGFLSYQYLMDNQKIELSDGARRSLSSDLGFDDVALQYLPQEIFSTEAMSSPSGIIILLLGGLLVGFGARYAGGCTSGHAITGLSNLQWPSLIAVIGFFIGGLIMTFFGLPLIFN